ncbi:MAG: histidinol-phosphate transaminase [Duncaniella sp.]|uniref:histidinol-phosphate transaminase n=1 Tax=Duncaniella sp. TaxID=2518496 RepID=UPI0023BCDBD4|nr:histidinol-phosphate transaminase [Duncaniella sp.]MDE6090959.1 histidinol-phosphate transaminase [Duncaniella sp.]
MDKKINPLDFVRPNILALEPYSTARDEFKGGDISVWLDANENPYPNGLNRYPDPHQKKLKHAIAALKGVREEQIFIGGAGSDEAIDLVYRIFCRPGIDNVISIAPTYGVYEVSAEINDIALRKVPLGDDYSLPVDALLDAADSNSKIMWICSPNNPTGNAFHPEEIIRLLESFNGMVVVDEAYIDFSPYPSLLGVLDKYPNLIVMQTFSKAWGMASLRMGMAFASPEIAELFARVKYPYNVNGPTQEELLRRIESTDIRNAVNEIISERSRLADTLQQLAMVHKVHHSDANFLLVEVDDPDGVYDGLIADGVIVRNRNRVTGCKGCLRFTVGTPAENDRVITLMKEMDRK